MRAQSSGRPSAPQTYVVDSYVASVPLVRHGWKAENGLVHLHGRANREPARDAAQHAEVQGERPPICVLQRLGELANRAERAAQADVHVAEAVKQAATKFVDFAHFW